MHNNIEIIWHGTCQLLLGIRVCSNLYHRRKGPGSFKVLCLLLCPSTFSTIFFSNLLLPCCWVRSLVWGALTTMLGRFTAESMKLFRREMLKRRLNYKLFLRIWLDCFSMQVTTYQGCSLMRGESRYCFAFYRRVR